MRIKLGDVVYRKDDKRIYIINTANKYIDTGKRFWALDCINSGLSHYESDFKNFFKFKNQVIARILFWPGGQLRF